MVVKEIVFGCDYIWLRVGSRKLTPTDLWYYINDDIDKEAAKRWFPNAYRLDYGDSRLSNVKKEEISKALPFSLAVLSTIVDVKGDKRLLSSVLKKRT